VNCAARKCELCGPTLYGRCFLLGFPSSPRNLRPNIRGAATGAGDVSSSDSHRRRETYAQISGGRQQLREMSRGSLLPKNRGGRRGGQLLREMSRGSLLAKNRGAQLGGHPLREMSRGSLLPKNRGAQLGGHPLREMSRGSLLAKNRGGQLGGHPLREMSRGSLLAKNRGGPRGGVLVYVKTLSGLTYTLALVRQARVHLCTRCARRASLRACLRSTRVLMFA
jgi:hypothetical protein